MIQWCEHKHFMCEVYGESVMDEWTLLKFLTVDQLSKHRKSGPACKCLKGIHLQLVLKMKSVSRTSWSHFQNVGWLNDLNSHSISKLITLTQWNAWVMMSVSMSWTQSIQNFGREQTSLFKYFPSNSMIVLLLTMNTDTSMSQQTFQHGWREFNVM